MNTGIIVKTSGKFLWLTVYILFCNDYTIILRSDDALVLPRCYSKASRCRRAYILPLWFSFFFSTPNLWGHWTDLNHTWTHIHLWLLFEKFGPNTPQAFNLPRAGGKKTLFGTDFKLWPNIYLQWRMIATIEKKLVNSQDSFTFLQNLVNFGPQTAENGWRVFAHS